MIGEKVGPYTILEIIGSGSLGTVYKVEDPRGRQVALKLVRSHFLNTMEKREQFLQQALEASEILHENICPIYEIGDDNNDFFIVMPFITGKTLTQHMAMGLLPWLRAIDIALAIGSAIEALHNAHAVHRAIKPGHVWVLGDHPPGVLLTDGCIGQSIEASGREQRESVISGVPSAAGTIPLETAAYMSPEQIRGESLDHRTDIFSFAVVVYEMLSGRHPFGMGNSLPLIISIQGSKPLPRAAAPSPVISRMESILRHALANKREQRYQSIHAMLADIKAVRDGECAAGTPAQASLGLKKWFYSKFRHRF
jgi:eukaryotic-like serine/threonine-protein kinase